MKAIMLMYDSLNRKMLEPYGCDWTRTPNFRRLAQRSVQFDHCYAGSLPCMPARRELHTGRYNFLHRSWGPLEPFDDSMPEILRENGVFSMLVSDHAHYWEDGGATYHNRYSCWQGQRGQEGDPWKAVPSLLDGTARVQNQDGMYFHSMGRLQRQDAVNRAFLDTEEKMPMARTFADGLEFLHLNHAADNWFLQIETFDPHEPFFVPEEYKAVYPDAYAGEPFDWPPYHQVTEDEPTREHLRMQYAALLSMCDKYLGKLLDAMDEYDLWKDTLLIVNTDHGYLLGEHGWWSKCCMPLYDEVVHTPLFVHDPRFTGADGQRRGQIVQTIDLPATILEFFGQPLPPDMQGKPLRTVIERNQPIRDCALFGVHGGHINVFDGRYVYMKAPEQANQPLYEYTLMPTHMRARFGVKELEKSRLVQPFSFTKNCPVLQIPKANGVTNDNFGDLLFGRGDPSAVREINNNSLTNAANYGDLLFDLETDSEQEHPLEDAEICARLAGCMVRLMHENDAPAEQFLRIGLPAEGPVTVQEIRRLACERSQKEQPPILPQYSWSRGAVNAYNTLVRFMPGDKKQLAVQTAEKELPVHARDGRIDCEMVLALLPLVLEEEYVEKLRYFVSIAGREL